MSFGNNPSINPANDGTLTGTIQFAVSKMVQALNGMLPARVIKYDRTTNRVQVQLLINMITTDGSQVPRSQLASLPVLSLGGNGFTVNFPLKSGDLGWVLAADRDISLFLQSYSESRPNTTRMKNFADGLFIPDVMRGYTVASEDTEAMVIQNQDGTVKIALGADGIRITSTGVEGVTITAPTVTVDGNLVVTGTINGQGGVTVTGGSGFNVTGNMNLTGNVAVVGNITATGSITPNV